MYEQVLNAYLFQHRSISIPGLGTIYLETFPATVDVADRTMLPPVYRFRFDKYFDAPDKEFFAYLAAQGNMLDFEAIKWYNEFSFDLRNRIRSEEAVSWEGVGILKKDGSGNILFESAPAPAFFQQATPAMRVNRQDAVHTLLVGDRERTSGEMNEWLHEEETHRRKFPWWIIALILAVLGLAVLGWSFYEHGWATGNQTKF
jgi:CCDC81-like prokaryotic HU domain 1